MTIMKKNMLFLFAAMMVCCLNVQGQVADFKEERGWVKDFELLNSLGGKWEVVTVMMNDIEVDCEHFEESLSKMLKENPDNHLEITNRFNDVYKNIKNKIIEISDHTVFNRGQKKKTVFKEDNSLEEDVILVEERGKKTEMKVIKLDEHYFKLIHSEKEWLKFKRVMD